MASVGLEENSMDAPAIMVRDLVKDFDGIKAVDGVTFEVAKGEVFGFLGTNGAGTTTTLKPLLGLAQPRAGTIAVLGGPPTHVANRRRIGYMPEHAYYPEQRTARALATSVSVSAPWPFTVFPSSSSLTVTSAGASVPWVTACT